jgi:hypothetical protein
MGVLGLKLRNKTAAMHACIAAYCLPAPLARTTLCRLHQPLLALLISAGSRCCRMQCH